MQPILINYIVVIKYLAIIFFFSLFSPTSQKNWWEECLNFNPLKWILCFDGFFWGVGEKKFIIE